MKVSNRLINRTMAECLWQAPISSLLPSSNVPLDSIFRIYTRVFSAFATNKIGDREEDVRQEIKDTCSVSSSKGIEDCHCQELPLSGEPHLEVKYNRTNLKDLSQDSFSQINSLRTACKENVIPVPILESLLQGKDNSFTVDLVGHVLRSLLDDWESALRIFLWLGKQPHYKHKSETLELMIHILGKGNQFQIMWQLIEEMKSEVSLIRPKTLEVVIRSYVKAGMLEDLMDAFERVKDFNFEFRRSAFNSLVRVLCYEKRVEDCLSIFERLKGSFPPDDKTYSILIHGCCESNRLTDALAILDEMIQEGIRPTWGAYTSLIEVLCDKNMVYIAKKLFNHMKKSIFSSLKETKEVTDASERLGILNEITPTLDFTAYNCLVTSLCTLGEVDDACELLEKMVRQGFTPYAKTYSCVFYQLCKRRKSKEAFELYRKVANTVFFPSLQIHDNLIEMFCCTGHVSMALDLWNKIQDKGYNCGRQSYSVLIHGLCYNGLFTEAFEHFKKMIEKGIIPLYQTYRMLHFGLLQGGNMDKFDELKEMIEQLKKQGIQLVTRRKQ